MGVRPPGEHDGRFVTPSSVTPSGIEGHAFDFVLCRQTILQYWAIVDGISRADLATCVTNDCYFRIANREFKGLAELRAGVRQRLDEASVRVRTTRHFVSNSRVQSCAELELTVSSFLTVFSGYGERPVILGPPSSIAEVVCKCSGNPERGWRIARLECDVIFAGEDSPFARSA